MRINDNCGVTGVLGIKFRHKETGEIVDEFKQYNVITKEGFAELSKRLSGNTDTSYIDHIVLGTDVGSGTQIEPEPAKDYFTASFQTELYTIPASDITVTYVSPTVFSFGCILDGAAMLSELGTTESEARFSSATLRFNNGKTCSFKRFTVKSITSIINIEVTWTINLSESK